MERTFHFGLQLTRFSDPSGLAATARRAEDLGYEGLYVPDHVGAADPFAPLLVAAEATTTLRVGTLVLNNELHHPVLLARTAATVDRLTGGRLVLGMGTGYMQAEHDAVGLPLRPPGPRVERLGETLAVLRDLLDTGAATLDGVHHTVAVDDLGIRPAQAKVPILVGGHGPRVVRLAAARADVFQFTGLTHGPGGVPEPGGIGYDSAALRAAWLSDAAGDRDGDLTRSALVQATKVGEGSDAAIRQTADHLKVDEDVVRRSPFLMFGSVDTLTDKLVSLRDELGISHLVVRDAEDFAPVVAALAGR